MIGHRLNTPLDVWRPVVTLDAGGGQQTVWQQIGQIYGQVSQPSADERRIAQQDGAQLTHIVHTIYGADVKRGDELAGELPSEVRDGERLRVLSAVSDSRRTYLRVETQARQAS